MRVVGVQVKAKQFANGFVAGELYQATILIVFQY